MGGCWQRRLRWKRIVDPDLDAASAAPWARDIRRPSLSPLKPTAQWTIICACCPPRSYHSGNALERRCALDLYCARRIII